MCLKVVLLRGIVFLLFTTVIYSQSPLNLKQLVDSLDSAKQSVSQVSTPKQNKSTQLFKIEIEGLKNVKESSLRSRITIKKGDSLSPSNINRVVKNIQSLGVLKQVDTEVKNSSDGKVLKIIVQEHPIVSKIKFEGNSVFTDNELYSVILSKSNQVFSLAKVRKDIQSIEKIYEDSFYSKVSVIGVENPKKNGDSLVFKISEGFIEEIVVTGNNKTQTYVIKREMDLKKGDIIRQDLLNEDLRRIYNLNYFTNIIPQLLPGKKLNSHKLNLEVTEKPTSGSFSFGGGYSAVSGLSFFSDLFWDNLMGTGQMIMLKGQFGRASTYQFKYSNPWMWSNRRSLTLRTWLTDGGMGSVSPLGNVSYRDERRIGADVSIGVPFSYDLKTFYTFKYEKVRLKTLDKYYRDYGVAFNIVYDTRDFWHNPRAGFAHSFSIEKGLNMSKDAINYTQYDLDLKTFNEILDDQVFATRSRIGYLSTLINDDDIFGSKAYRLGGGETVRGYDDRYPFAYGDKQLILNLEYRFLFNDAFQAVLFADAGYSPNVRQEDGTIISRSLRNIANFKVGKGIGLRFMVPALGPLRLDAGMDELGVVRIHFNIGHAF